MRYRAAKEHHFPFHGALNRIAFPIARRKVIPACPHGLGLRLHARDAQVGKDVDLGDALGDGTAKIVIRQAGSSVKHQRCIHSAANFTQTVKGEPGRAPIRAVRPVS